jgi:signal peptidase I
MKRIIKIPLIFCGSLIILAIAAHFLGAFRLNTCATPANVPSLKVGDRFFTSKLVKPERFDFVTYTAEIPDYGTALVCYRLCGLPGDLVEIRDGVLHINNTEVDSKLPLSHEYFVTASELQKIKEVVNVEEENISDSYGMILVLLEDQHVKQFKIQATRFILPKAPADPTIKKIYKQDWTVDNFGPIRVPENKYFVLGDNRHRAYDSRYYGFVDQSQIHGTVVLR